MNQPYQPFTGKVSEILLQEVRLLDANGRSWTFPLAAFEATPRVGDEITLLAVPRGGEAAGKSAFAASLLNELLASE